MTIIRYLDGTVINLNDIGIRTIDFDVPSPNYINHFESIEGRAGVGYLGSDVGPRDISVRCRAVANDQIDFPFLRSEIFNLIPTHEEFYISEGHWSSVQWLVRPANGFDVDKLNLRTIFTIPFVGIEGYAQSVYTSLELHDSGYTAGSGTVPSGLTSSNYQTLFGSVGNSQLLASDIQKLERDLNVLKRNVNRYEGEYGLVDGIDDEKVKYRFTDNNFTVYNFGSVTVEPESMMLNITIGYVENTETFKLENKTTGDVFEINKHLSGRNIYLRGVTVTEGGATNIFRETNKRFISLAPGNNEFEVTGGTFSQISFDFRGYYK